jgi:hypothetical protein
MNFISSSFGWLVDRLARLSTRLAEFVRTDFNGEHSEERSERGKGNNHLIPHFLVGWFV